MTAMRNGVYALLAVVVGVALIGVLPGQLSNLAVHTIESTSLRSPSTGAVGNVSLSGTGTRVQTVNSTYSNTAASAAKTSASEEATKGDAAAQGASLATVSEQDPYADMMYYGYWGIGLVAAIAVYIIAKRVSG